MALLRKTGSLHGGGWRALGVSGQISSADSWGRQGVQQDKRLRLQSRQGHLPRQGRAGNLRGSGRSPCYRRRRPSRCTPASQPYLSEHCGKRIGSAQPTGTVYLASALTVYGAAEGVSTFGYPTDSIRPIESAWNDRQVDMRSVSGVVLRAAKRERSGDRRSTTESITNCEASSVPSGDRSLLSVPHSAGRIRCGSQK